MKPEEKHRRYVEEIALHFEQRGFSRSAGRILGWLLISDPPHQTMNELVEALQVSKSSISTATRTLIQYGIIERISLPGIRPDYYRMVEGVWQNAIRQEFGRVTEISRLAQQGLALLSDRPAEQRERLQEMYDLHVFLEKEMARLLARWDETRSKER